MARYGHGRSISGMKKPKNNASTIGAPRYGLIGPEYDCLFAKIMVGVGACGSDGQPVQGYSTLHAAASEEGIQAADGKAISGVASILETIGAEDFGGEGSDAGQDAGVLAHTGGVPGHDGIADVVGAVAIPRCRG